MNFLRISTVLMFLATSPASIEGSPLSENVTRVLNDLLKKPYDKRIRPLLGENALFVRVSFNLDSFLGVDEDKSEMSVRLTLKQNWLEPRLTFPSGAVPNDTMQLGPEQTKFLWMPDTVISNQRRLDKLEGHESTFLNYEGVITSSAKISLTFDCGLTLDTFPFDTQTCSINFLSHAHDRRDVIYEWMTEDSLITGRNGALVAGRFTLLSFETKSYTSTTKQGSSILLVLRLHLQGAWKPFLVSYFIPLAIFTGISISSLWIGNRTQKSGILIIFFNLALFNIYMAIATVGKNTNIRIQGTALGQYMIISLVFICLSLAVHILNLILESKEAKHETGKSKIDEEEDDVSLPRMETGKEKDIELANTSHTQWEEEPRRKSAASQRDMPPPDYVLYFRKLRVALVQFVAHAHWILWVGFLLCNSFYFGVHVTSYQGRVEEMLRNIRT